MKRYVAFAAGAKKPEGNVSEKLMAAFKAELHATIELEKSDKWKDYAKAMKQAGSAAFWVFVVNSETSSARAEGPDRELPIVGGLRCQPLQEEQDSWP